uniref:Uncharacterized protein n=1 Tax=Romanomermis culicivorax TaxID=13658 RepID=A0A915IF43_ROMCU
MDGEPQMAVKYSHTDEFKMADASTQRQRGRPNMPWKPLYDSLLPISVAKKVDLLSLCQQKLIPVEFHAWIQSLLTGETVVETESSASEDDNDDDEQPLAMLKR